MKPKAKSSMQHRSIVDSCFQANNKGLADCSNGQTTDHTVADLWLTSGTPPRLLMAAVSHVATTSNNDAV